jgi:hypothetical protein
LNPINSFYDLISKVKVSENWYISLLETAHLIQFLKKLHK